MRIKEEIKRLGYFWLPSAPNRVLAGILSISDGGNIELEVVHRLGGRSGAFGDDVKRIVGQIEKDGLVTLDDCYYKPRRSRAIGGPSKSFIHVGKTFIGIKYDEGESPVFNTLTFSVEGIDEWIGISGINVDYQLEEHTATISYQPPETVSLNLDNGMQLLITFERIINNWIEAYEKITPAFNLYFLAKMGMQTYLEERFMALAQGLEAYHRRTSDEKQMDEAEFEELVKNLIDQCPEEKKKWLRGKLQYGNELSLRNRLKGIIEPFKDIIGNQGKRSQLIDRIMNTRNYLTHYDLSLESKAAKDKNLWTLCLKMELLFQLHFLKLIGFSREQIDSLVANSIPLRWKL